MSIFTEQPGADTPQTVLEAIAKTMGKSKPAARIGKDSFVIPNAGPHKGMRHKVTAMHEDGSMTVVPWDIGKADCKYRNGMAKARPEQVEAVNEEVLDEEIKGWKHAGRDLAKIRSQATSATHQYKLHRLKADGGLSRMHDAAKTFPDLDKATAYHTTMVKNNPTRNIRHALFINGKQTQLLEGVVNEEFNNWTFEMKAGDKTKVVSGDHTGKRGVVVEKHNGGESYTVQHADGSKMKHHISTLTPMNEEVLSELSTDVLKKYVAKATSAADGHFKAARELDHDSSAKFGATRAAMHREKGRKRLWGVDDAESKLAKKKVNEDVEQINELSRKTIKSYREKSSADGRYHFDSAIAAIDSKRHDKEANQHLDKWSQRTRGQTMADRELKKYNWLGKKKKVNEEQIDELSQTYTAPARVPQKMIKPEAASRMANTVNRKNMSDKDVETVLFNQGHGRKSLNLIKQLRKEDVEQIQELSKATLGRYIKVASDDKESIMNRARDFSKMGKEAQGEGEREEAVKWYRRSGELAGKHANRRTGIRKAVDKLTKD